MKDKFAPCGLCDRGDGSYSLVLSKFPPVEHIFEEMGYEAGGYGWHGMVEALVRMKAPELAPELEYDPEASMFVVISDDPKVLERVAGLIRRAVKSPSLLREALANVDPELMD